MMYYAGLAYYGVLRENTILSLFLPGKQIRRKPINLGGNFL